MKILPTLLKKLPKSSHVKIWMNSHFEQHLLKHVNKRNFDNIVTCLSS